jgi:hypothetical protein
MRLGNRNFTDDSRSSWIWPGIFVLSLVGPARREYAFLDRAALAHHTLQLLRQMAMHEFSIALCALLHLLSS